MPVQKRPGVPASTTVRQPAIRSARSNAVPSSRIKVELILFPIGSRDSDIQLTGNLLADDSFELQLPLARKCGKDLHTTLVGEFTLRLIRCANRLPRFQVPRFEIQPATFPNQTALCGVASGLILVETNFPSSNWRAKCSLTFFGSKSRKVPPDAKCWTNILPTA